jgi:hypothetical protein
MSAKHSRILLMDIGAPFGGVETYLANLAALLQGRCKIYCICALPQLAELLRSQSVHVICIPILFHRLAKIARFFLCVPVLIYMMLRYRIDTVQFNGYLESWLIPLVRMFGRRVFAQHMVLPRSIAIAGIPHPSAIFPALVRCSACERLLRLFASPTLCTRTPRVMSTHRASQSYQTGSNHQRACEIAPN